MDRPPNGARIEDVQRPVVGRSDVIRDIDEGRNRAQADGGQTALEPIGGLTVLHPAKIAADEQRTGLGIAAFKTKLHGERRLELGLNLFHVQGVQSSEALGGEIACDAAHAQGIGTVGRDLHIDHRIIKAERHGGGSAYLEIARQIDDALMIIGDLQLALGHQHAVRFDAADEATLEIDAGARNMRAGMNKDAGHAGAGVRRAADDLYFALGSLDQTNAQPVGIRMLLSLLDLGDLEGSEVPGAIHHLLDFEADTHQRPGDFIQ